MTNANKVLIATLKTLIIGWEVERANAKKIDDEIRLTALIIKVKRFVKSLEAMES